jgi:hypothetical protein
MPIGSFARLGSIRASLVVALTASVLANVILLRRHRSQSPGRQEEPRDANLKAPGSPMSAPCLPSAADATEPARGADQDDRRNGSTGEMNPFARFEQERRDDTWAGETEAYLRPRIEKLAKLSAVRSFDVECRASCCLIRFESNEQFFLDLQSSAGVPLLGSSMVGDDFIAVCRERGEPFPATQFIDRLDDRVSQAAAIASAETECGGVAEEPVSMKVRVAIQPNGDFTLQSSGSHLGTSAAACVEDSLHRDLRFGPAKGMSTLQLMIHLRGR